MKTLLAKNNLLAERTLMAEWALLAVKTLMVKEVYTILLYSQYLEL
jgi:hypothetical protein